MLEFLGFSCFFILLILSVQGREHLRSKTSFEWVLDISNLTIQGTLVPFLRVVLVIAFLKASWPEAEGSLKLSFIGGFCLNFFLVDYLYYWNHRILHWKKLFAAHIVHHTVDYMDVFATSRNTLWTSFVILYLWVNGALIYLTGFNKGFILSMSLTAVLDIWKHSQALRNHPEWQLKLSRLGLTTPLDHAWHHSSQLHWNYGANLNIYDRIHGTYLEKESYPERLGVKTGFADWQTLIFPFKRRSKI